MKRKKFKTSHENFLVATLEKYRKEMGLGVKAFCSKTGLNHRTYESWLAGAREPVSNLIFLFCRNFPLKHGRKQLHYILKYFLGTS